MQRHNLDSLGLLRHFVSRLSEGVPEQINRVLFWDEMFTNLGQDLPTVAGSTATIEVSLGFPSLLEKHPSSD